MLKRLLQTKTKKMNKKENQGLSVCISVFYMLYLTPPLFPSPCYDLHFTGMPVPLPLPSLQFFPMLIKYQEGQEPQPPPPSPPKKALWGSVFVWTL